MIVIRIIEIHYQDFNEVYTYNTGLIQNHFFLIEPTNITSHAIENYTKIKEEKDCNFIIKQQNGYFKRDKKPTTSSFEVSKTVVKSVKYSVIDASIRINKSDPVSFIVKFFLGTYETLLYPTSYENTSIASTQFYNQIEPCFNCLAYFSSNVREIEKKIYRFRNRICKCRI